MHRSELKSLALFLTHIALVALGGAAICLAIVWAGYDSNAYAKSLSMKIRLLQETPSPRAIIIGGSGAALGFDSAIFEKKTGLHVVNTGLYAGLGMRFMSRIISPYIRKGDTVIVLPEYELLHQPATGDGEILLETLRANPKFIPDALNAHSLIAMMRAFPNWLETQVVAIWHRTIGTVPQSVYHLSNVTSEGDLSSTVHDKAVILPEDLAKASVEFVRPHADRGALASISAFVAGAEARGARVYISWAPLPDSAYKLNKDSVLSRAEEMQTTFGNRLVGDPRDFVYRASYFFDAPTHLNSKGATVRTDDLIRRLR